MIYWQIAAGSLWLLTTVSAFYKSQENGNPAWNYLLGITLGRGAALVVLYKAGAFSLIHG